MPTDKKPVFVKVDDYEKILSKLNLLNEHLKRAREQLDTIKKLKEDEDKELREWEDEIEMLEEKISFITETISKKD